jgi:hypothetical protein
MLHDLTPAATHMALDTLRMLRPRKLVGSEKVRLGRLYDGGYVMIDRFDGVEAAYSLGINDDVSWDLDVAARGIPCFQYDPTIEALPKQHSLFQWKPVWIGGDVDRAANRETLESLIGQNGHENSRNLILKCDIEGAEWPVLQQTPTRVMRQFRQIVIEFHNLGMLADPNHGNNVRNAFLNLTASHHVVHVHANNFAGWQVVGGVPVPEVLELTLLRKDEGQFDISDERFPSELDMPCHSGSADMYLGRFEFL